jgi:predicted transcriptional regulator of viral defense system
MSVGKAILSGMTADSVPDSSRLAGIVTTAELVAAGIGRPQLRSLVRRGVLVPVSRGVYARGPLAAAETRDPRDEHALRVAAAVAVSGPETVGSHHSAAVIHRIDMLGRRLPRTVALTRPLGAAGSRTARPGVAMHTAGLPAEHVTARYGVPVTSVARTVVDMARTSSFRAGVVAADSALRDKQISTAELHSVLTDCRRWCGIQRARQVVAFSDARSESVFESISRVVFHDEGLPPPELQAWVGGEDAVIGRADFLWRAHRTIGEADGAVKYSGPSRAIAQLQRDARLREAGFEVVHFTWDEIIRVPGQVAASIRAAFRRGGSR